MYRQTEYKTYPRVQPHGNYLTKPSFTHVKNMQHKNILNVAPEPVTYGTKHRNDSISTSTKINETMIYYFLTKTVLYYQAKNGFWIIKY